MFQTAVTRIISTIKEKSYNKPSHELHFKT